MQETDGGQGMLDVDAAMQMTLCLDPAATREGVSRYVQEIDDMSKVLDIVDVPLALESIVFSPTWPAADPTTESG